MIEPIDDLIDQNLEASVKKISRENDYRNTFVVERESLDVGPPDTISPQDVYCLIVPGEVVPADPDTTGQAQDDYIGTWFLLCYVFESKRAGGRWDKRMRSIHWDVRRALMTDRNRGSHPTSGSGLAIWTRIITARPMDLEHAEHRGVIIQVDVRFRTRLDDGFNQA